MRPRALSRVVSLPEAITYEDAAVVPLQGLTAHYLATSTFPLEPKQRIFRSYRLNAIAEAQRALEARETSGKLLVIR
jgi:hypothetical protein